MTPPTPLVPHLDMEFPIVFSSAEMARRRRALDRVAAEAGVGAVLLWGAQRSGGSVPWLTGWPVTAEAHVLVLPDDAPVLWVSYVNHLPNARRLASGADVRPGGRGTLTEIARRLDDRGVRSLGVVGSLPWTQAEAFGDCRLVDLNPSWGRLRLVKSPEEMAALRTAALLTDQAMAAMVNEALVGASEHELQARIQASYLKVGGLHQVSYLAVTSVSEPDRCVPSQWATSRRVRSGDTVSCELSAAAAPDLAGQLLRTFVAAEPVPAIVAELHAVADACLAAIEARLRPGTTAADLVAASGLVEDAGFTTVDDVVHGYGGGYLAPVLSTRSRQPPRAVPDFTLAAGMTVVVQPNVVTPDRSFGVQTGELMAVTEDGPVRLHAYPRGLQVAT
jgi:Xaa-Pro dipeptidase